MDNNNEFICAALWPGVREPDDNPLYSKLIEVV
jgi:hypothetical protein